MDLLIPETGTMVWMLIAFLIVFGALIKWGFPAITGMVDKRKEFIDKSLESAKEANARLAGIQQECETLLKETRAERTRILNDAAARRDDIIAEARQKAEEEGAKAMAEAREKILLEKEEAIRGIRRQVAEISVDIAEKVIMSELSGSGSQQELVDRLIDDVKISRS